MIPQNNAGGSFLFENYIRLVIEPVQVVPRGNIVYKSIKEVNILGIRICPRATEPNEPPECEPIRADFANDSPILLNNGWQVGFFNNLAEFPPAIFCSNNFGPGFHSPTVEELQDPFVQAELLNRGLCPMVVWALSNGVPTLVKLRPGTAQPVKILPTPSESCLAFTMCISQG
jgi:hypothetical protein